MIIMFYLSFTTNYCVIRAQVGINTVTPQATLDIIASNVAAPNAQDGILIPRVDEFPLTNPTAAQDGMLLFATGNGSIAKGFYFWEQGSSSWNKFYAQNNTANWYEVASVTSADNISDDIFTQGNVGINELTPIWPLEVLSANGGRGVSIAMNGSNNASSYGAFSEVNNTGDGAHAGFVTRIQNDGNGTHYGVQTLNNGAGTGIHYGMLNQLLGSGQGVQAGIGTSIANTGDNTHYGLRNDLSGSGNGVHYGTYNSVTGTGTGNKFGTRTYIDPGAGGTHYGVYAEALGGTAFAAYFLGNVSIGTNTANNYVLPASDGPTNYGMITDGSGSLQWQPVLTQSHRLAFKTRLTTAVTGLANNIEQSLIFDNVQFNYGNGVYDTSLGEFRITDDGVYEVAASLAMDFSSAATASMVLHFRVYVDGILQSEQLLQGGAIHTTSSVNHFNFHFTESLSTGNVVQFRILPSWGAATPAPSISVAGSYIGINREY